MHAVSKCAQVWLLTSCAKAACPQRNLPSMISILLGWPHRSHLWYAECWASLRARSGSDVYASLGSQRALARRGRFLRPRLGAVPQAQLSHVTNLAVMCLYLLQAWHPFVKHCKSGCVSLWQLLLSTLCSKSCSVSCTWTTAACNLVQTTCRTGMDSLSCESICATEIGALCTTSLSAPLCKRKC